MLNKEIKLEGRPIYIKFLCTFDGTQTLWVSQETTAGRCLVKLVLYEICGRWPGEGCFNFNSKDKPPKNKLLQIMTRRNLALIASQERASGRLLELSEKVYLHTTQGCWKVSLEYSWHVRINQIFSYTAWLHCHSICLGVKYCIKYQFFFIFR